MQYPEIQFYRGSLVRLATGQLKHVEDLSSDDFIESARLATTNRQPASAPPGRNDNAFGGATTSGSHSTTPSSSCNGQRIKFDFNPLATAQHHRQQQQSHHLDENNNGSVFNSPEPNASNSDDSPRMKTDDFDEEDEEIDVELDVVNDDHQDQMSKRLMQQQHQHQGLNLTSRMQEQQTSANQMHRQVKLEPFGSSSSAASSATTTPFSFNRMDDDLMNNSSTSNSGSLSGPDEDQQDFYVDSSVVRDFLEVGPIQIKHQASGKLGASSTSLASSTNSLNDHHNNQKNLLGQGYSFPSTSSSSSSNSLQSSISPPVVMPQILSAPSATPTSQTVLIKFFLETSRSVVFIEVPIEHPFFVFHRGWSSWNPQRTYDKFGLKCRKLKIGDTCISLIRRRPKNQKQQDSDQCNILFSSIQINE